jgi:hypothetical protein
MFRLMRLPVRAGFFLTVVAEQNLYGYQDGHGLDQKGSKEREKLRGRERGRESKKKQDGKKGHSLE